MPIVYSQRSSKCNRKRRTENGSLLPWDSFKLFNNHRQYYRNVCTRYKSKLPDCFTSVKRTINIKSCPLSTDKDRANVIENGEQKMEDCNLGIPSEDSTNINNTIKISVQDEKIQNCRSVSTSVKEQNSKTAVLRKARKKKQLELRKERDNIGTKDLLRMIFVLGDPKGIRFIHQTLQTDE
ncbi:hypothetical protein CEXT_132141 [Caerostris extrusa]|uniref:Uncharacterized protein n=1 Tax=Caerostris extrusa TaxID=172846 RepID=A0AAV4WH33_CAEEX|nr:hypothetical protein CEXT_132141 [Caerostris extrusa]